MIRFHVLKCFLENMYALLTVPYTFHRRVNLGLSGVNILWIFDWSFVLHKWPKTEWISAVLLVECTVWRVFQRLTAKRQFMSKIETGHFLGFNSIFKAVLFWFSNLKIRECTNMAALYIIYLRFVWPWMQMQHVGTSSGFVFISVLLEWLLP